MADNRSIYDKSLDLSWFSMRTYEVPLTLQDWVLALQFRLDVDASIKDGRTDHPQAGYPDFHLMLSNLKAPPNHRFFEPRHHTDKPAIAFMTGLDFISLMGLQQCDDPSQPYDLINLALARLAQKTDPEWPVSMDPSDDLSVHLKVNLACSKKQLLKQFASWLDSAVPLFGKVTSRDYRLMVEEWAANKLLPFYDLRLYSRYRETDISQHRMVELLELDPCGDPSDLLKTPRRSLTVFTRPLVNAMALQLAMEESGCT